MIVLSVALHMRVYKLALSEVYPLVSVQPVCSILRNKCLPGGAHCPWHRSYKNLWTADAGG